MFTPAQTWLGSTQTLLSTAKGGHVLLDGRERQLTSPSNLSHPERAVDCTWLHLQAGFLAC